MPSLATKGTLVATTLGLSMLALPLRITDPRDGLIRVNEACGQATECYISNNYICSTYHSDYKDYKCSQGCKDT